MIIGILAALVIVAYSGIQTRASNAQRIVAAKEWEKLIKEYLSQNNKYPLVSGGTYCIGESNALDYDGNSANQDCGLSDNLKHDGGAGWGALFNTEMKTVRTTLPNFPGKPVKVTSTIDGMGMLMREGDIYDMNDENIANYPTLIYFLEGPNQDCVLRPLVTPYIGGNFTKLSDSAINSYSGVCTACRVMLPDRNKL